MKTYNYINQNKFLNLINLGKNFNEICNELNISKNAYYKELNRLKPNLFNQKLNRKKQQSLSLKKFAKENPGYCSNYVSNGYKKIFDKLENIIPFNLNDTIKLLKDNNYYLNFKGRSKNRKMINENPKLYVSIINHSEILKKLCTKSPYNFQFYARIIFLVKYGGILKIKNGIKFIYDYKNFNFKVSITPHGSSRISQELFLKLFEYLPEKNEMYFTLWNGEFMFKFPWIKKEGGVDFKYKNKIIEFDGSYWHNKVTRKASDNLKDNYLKSIGYEILRVKEQDYYDNKEKVIKDCLFFLNFIPNKNNLEVLTSDGFKRFDGLSQNFKKIIKLTLENDLELECSEKHLILTDSGFKEFNSLTFNDKIKTDLGYVGIKNSSLISLENEEVFDLVNVEDTNSYYTNNIISHNCVSEDSKITLKDTITGKIFITTFKELWENEDY